MISKCGRVLMLSSFWFAVRRGRMQLCEMMKRGGVARFAAWSCHKIPNAILLPPPALAKADGGSRMAQPRYRRSPMAEGGRAANPLSLGAPAVPRRHVGLHAGLVDEDQLARVRPALKARPPLAAALHVGPVALVRDGRQLLVGKAADSQKAPNRGETRRDASPAKPILQPRQRDCRTGLDPLKDPSPASRQLRRAARAHPARAGRSRVGISSSPFDHARRGHPQLLRNAPAAFARLHLLDRAHPQIV